MFQFNRETTSSVCTWRMAALKVSGVIASGGGMSIAQPMYFGPSSPTSPKRFAHSHFNRSTRANSNVARLVDAQGRRRVGDGRHRTGGRAFPALRAQPFAGVDGGKPVRDVDGAIEAGQVEGENGTMSVGLQAARHIEGDDVEALVLQEAPVRPDVLRRWLGHARDQRLGIVMPRTITDLASGR